MVVDYINNAFNYNTLHPSFKEGLEFALSLKDKEVGRYEKGEMFCMVQEGETSLIETGDFEAHIKYIDVQILLEGQEILEWEDIKNLSVSIAYDEQKDAGFYNGTGETITVKPGMFYVMFPCDGHKPCKHIKEMTKYRKLVLKLKVE